ncbi:hypothetical protein PIB30_011431 [Stylosanthes scabra]|uniref:Uncharacterized protein n=1 Tax=Stylosanthes scabra TaxID=79078 RepID=A0ABU6Q5S6_9FABA|nr:hypothetical protein [Stylosanthes scabra]
MGPVEVNHAWTTFPILRDKTIVAYLNFGPSKLTRSPLTLDPTRLEEQLLRLSSINGFDSHLLSSHGSAVHRRLGESAVDEEEGSSAVARLPSPLLGSTVTAVETTRSPSILLDGVFEEMPDHGNTSIAHENNGLASSSPIGVVIIDLHSPSKCFNFSRNTNLAFLSS